MKFNWGTGIAIVIVVFIAAMIGIIIFSMNQRVNLVSPDYYPKGVNHEEHLQKQRNLASLSSKVTCKKENDSLYIVFPDDFKNKKVSGEIQFYFMTNFEKDIVKNIELDTDLIQVLPLNHFESGRYLLKISWVDGSKPYYQEIDINL